MIKQISGVRLSADSTAYWTDSVVSLPSFDGDDVCVVCPSTELQEGYLEEQVMVYIDTMKVVLVPADIYVEGSAQEYLALNNIEVTQQEQIDVSAPIHGTVAIMVSNREAISSLGEQVGEFSVASPMQYTLIRAAVNVNGVESLGKSYRKYAKRYAGRFTIIYNCPQNTYISVFDRSSGGSVERNLLFSDVFPSPTGADILYYMRWLERQFDIRQLPVYILGRDTEAVRDAIKKEFKKSVCE